MYAWTITEDRLMKPGQIGCGLGVMGPSTIAETHKRWLDTAATTSSELPTGFQRFTFRMYDDDRVLCYRGVLITDDPGSEESCVAPLDDYGRPNAGCTSIDWDGHPEWACE